MLFIWDLLTAANPLVLNDDCLTALEVARAKGHSNVVRTIEVQNFCNVTLIPSLYLDT